jgi:tetratricopeptide (TPR) repeat protein
LANGSPVSSAVKVTVKVTTGDYAVLYTDQQGMFEVDNLGPGIYTVEAEAEKAQNLLPATERIQIFRNMPAIVTLYLKEKGAESSSKPSSLVVSAGELDSKVPSKAAKEFDLATRAAKDNKEDESVAHLRKAISIYPNYLMAHNDLGTHLLAAGKLEEAEGEFRSAIKIDPKAFNPQLNLAIVLVQQHRFAEAADAAEKALALDAGSPAAHLYAGLAHMGVNDAERAERDLNAAYSLGGSKYALAQFHLGQIYLNKGEKALALKAFETYLRELPDAANAEQVKRLIGVLR